MRPVFKNNTLSQQFAEQGFVVIKDALDLSVLDGIEEFYTKLHIETSQQFLLSNLLGDLAVRKKIHEHLGRTLNEVLGEWLLNFKYVLGTLAIKPPTKDSSFAVHQDWSLVDESRYISLSAWMPLSDVDEQNGCVRILKDSCQIFGQPRGMNIPFPYSAYSDNISQEFMTAVPIRKGDMLVFDHRLVHDSGPNFSKLTRVAAVMAFIPNEAELCHYYKVKDKDTIDFYRLPEGFLIDNDFFDYSHAPEAPIMRNMKYVDPGIDFKKFKDLYEARFSRPVA
jgi:ectoine hydroxylase-related dioxygenase (phytanoyl-CoA dioxygenase family)